MIGGLPNLYARDLVRLLQALDGPEAAGLAALAAARIAEIDVKGGLAALKAELAGRRSDPERARVVPPLTALPL